MFHGTAYGPAQQRHMLFTISHETRKNGLAKSKHLTGLRSSEGIVMDNKRIRTRTHDKEVQRLPTKDQLTNTTSRDEERWTTGF